MLILIYSVIMTGTSPFQATQPSSFYSNSYLPKLEASMLKDFNCCGLNLPTFHDLLQHYEEVHPNADGAPASFGGQLPSGSGPAGASGSASQSQYGNLSNQLDMNSIMGSQGQLGVPQMMGMGGMGGIGQMMRQQQQSVGRNLGFNTSLQTVQDIESPEAGDLDIKSEVDAEGEDETPSPSGQDNGQISQMHQGGLAHNSRGMPSRYMGNPMAQLKAPPPVTSGILAQGRLYQHNPTVSSVNAPNLSTQPPLPQSSNHLEQNSAFGGESSLQGQQGGNTDFSDLTIDMSLPNTDFLQGGNYFGLSGIAGDMGSLTVDDPAKTLFSPNNGFNPSQHAQFAMAASQLSANPEYAQQVLAQQMIARGLLAGEESKPYKCPVIGCEKAYKNQNGLKYHKQVSLVSFFINHMSLTFSLAWPYHTKTS
jgi:transcription factor SFP1